MKISPEFEQRLSTREPTSTVQSVEPPPAGIRALANAVGVRAILENQTVLPMH